MAFAIRVCAKLALFGWEFITN